MKFDKRYLLVIPALAVAGAIAVNSVSAAGPRGFGGGMGVPGGGMHMIEFGDTEHFVERLTDEAELLGISLNDMKQYWSEGKGVKEIAEEKGISEEDLKTKMEAAAEAKMKAHLDELVEEGVITQAQANSRLEFMKQMKEKMGEEMKTKMQNRLEKRGAKALQTAPQQN